MMRITMINSPNENILRSERIIYSDSDIPKAAAVCLTLVLFIHVSKLICIGKLFCRFDTANMLKPDDRVP
jgi:hypothetical protein